MGCPLDLICLRYGSLGNLLNRLTDIICGGAGLRCHIAKIRTGLQQLLRRSADMIHHLKKLVHKHCHTLRHISQLIITAHGFRLDCYCQITVRQTVNGFLRCLQSHLDAFGQKEDHDYSEYDHYQLHNNNMTGTLMDQCLHFCHRLAGKYHADHLISGIL